MTNRLPTAEELRASLARNKPGRFLESAGFLGVISCAIAGIVVAYVIVVGYELGGRASAILLGAGVILGLTTGVLAYWLLLYVLGFHRKPVALPLVTKRRVMSSAQHSAQTREHQTDDELIPPRHTGNGDLYTEEDFPCPPSMPGRKTEIGSHFCDMKGKPGEVAFAVVQPQHGASSLELITIGERLQEWQANNKHVRRILGLESLLEGTLPAIRADMFSLASMSERVHVALIYVTKSADNESTGEDLLRVIAGLAVHVVSPDYFSKLRE